MVEKFSGYFGWRNSGGHGAGPANVDDATLTHTHAINMFSNVCAPQRYGTMETYARARARVHACA